MTVSRPFGADGALRAQKLSALAVAAASWGAGQRAPLELPPMRPTAHAAATLFGPWPKARWYRYSRAAMIARTLQDAGY